MRAERAVGKKYNSELGYKVLSHILMLTATRNFQQWAEIFESNTKGEAIKSKTFMKNFGERVRKQKDRVRLYMQEQEKAL